MIVKCIRCDTEFNSQHSNTHVCPNCKFVFAEGQSHDPDLEIVRSPDLARQSGSHRVHEEAKEKCSFHPDADALAHCKRCGKALCYVCAIATERGCFCEACSGGPEMMPEILSAKPEKPERKSEPAKEALPPDQAALITAGIPYVAWEYRSETGRLNSLFLTWQQSLFMPLRFFRCLRVTADYRSPLLYGLFWALMGLAGGVAWRIMLLIYPTISAFLAGKPLELSLQLSPKHIVIAGLALLSPLFVFVMLLGACVIYHIFVLASTRRHAGFRGTLRVICYSTGTNIFYFVPLLGVLVGGIWQLVLVTVGLKEVHGVSFTMAVTMALVPYTLLLIPSVAFTFWAIAGNDFGMTNLLTGSILSLLH